jgi:hypothetical protein
MISLCYNTKRRIRRESGLDSRPQNVIERDEMSRRSRCLGFARVTHKGASASRPAQNMGRRASGITSESQNIATEVPRAIEPKADFRVQKPDSVGADNC